MNTVLLTVAYVAFMALLGAGSVALGTALAERAARRRRARIRRRTIELLTRAADGSEGEA